ncbi:MAG: hypothetical protein DRP58_11695 [Spirochaetes bacterium]|nr:MAG: hypothetical protein DRP58_11695 [Spirochaetota bacterium]
MFPATGCLEIARGGSKFIANRRIMSYPGMKCGNLYTNENWRYLKRLKTAISLIDKPLQRIFSILLSATASQVSRLIPYRKNLSSGGPAWTVPGFWIPRVHIQLNVWRTFTNRYKRFLRAMKDVRNPGVRKISLCNKLKDLENSPGGFGYIYEGDSSKIALADESVDYVITDPPYGDSIPYLEFSQVWNEWIGRKPCFKKEVVISNSPERKKGRANYGNDLARVFTEIGRVLKTGKWATIFFQNRNLSVWNFLRLAARQAGLILKAVSFQYPAVISAKSQLAPNGSLTGDLVLQFQKCKTIKATPEKIGDTTYAILESMITDAVRKYRDKENSFDLIASDVLVKMWEEECDFEYGDIGKRIRKKLIR